MCAMYTQWKMKIDRKLEDSLREVLTHTITLLPPSRGESLLSIILLSTVSTHYLESLLVKCITYAGCWQPFPELWRKSGNGESGGGLIRVTNEGSRRFHNHGEVP